MSDHLRTTDGGAAVYGVAVVCQRRPAVTRSKAPVARRWHRSWRLWLLGLPAATLAPRGDRCLK